MSGKRRKALPAYVDSIRESGLTIYDPIEIGDPSLWIPTPELQQLLDCGLRGISVAGLPLRTRSKVVKECVCRVLGYPVPDRFARSKPRFPGQQFDIYVQKSSNLQVWNEELSPVRRYVLIRVSDADEIVRVKVVTGERLAVLDTTGTLTQKYQARFVASALNAELIVERDTLLLTSSVVEHVRFDADDSPADAPEAGKLLAIKSLFERLSQLVGTKFADRGSDQERNRGAELHRLACECLGYRSYQDNGQFPDIRHQLLEVKLQTSPTIDLGLVLPSSLELLDVPPVGEQHVRHCDVRYAVFSGQISNGQVSLDKLALTTGEAFFSRFTQFAGRVLNRKLQIPLPADFFDR